MSKSMIIQDYKENIDDRISMLEKFTGVVFKVRKHAISALMSVSFKGELIKKADKGLTKELNKQIGHDTLATLGDAVIKMVVSDYLIKLDNKISKGKLTVIKSELEKDQAFCNIVKHQNLHKLMLVSKNEEMGTKKLATYLESIVGAIYLSNGIKQARLFIINVLVEPNYNSVIGEYNHKSEMEVL